MNKKICSLVTILILLLVSCRKYEEGPLVSFKSRTSRVVNDWTVKQVYVNAQYEAGHLATGSKYSFSKDGKFSQDSTLTGTWRFLSNDEEIYLDYDVNSLKPMKYNINKLKEDAFWVFYHDSTDKKIELRME
jgi:hypothetical protein